jgi:hypothetical protein
MLLIGVALRPTLRFFYSAYAFLDSAAQRSRASGFEKQFVRSVGGVWHRQR